MLAAKNSKTAALQPGAAAHRSGTAAVARAPAPFSPLWHRLATRIQTKLSVGAADDAHEREADAVADRVMRMPQPVVQPVTVSRLSTTAIQRQPAPPAKTEERLDAIRQKLVRGEELSAEELAYAKQHISKEILQQLLGGPGQIRINIDPARPPQDISQRFRGRLELRMRGLPGAVAGSLEGVATADIDLVATVANEKAVITVAPPTESNRMAATIRQLMFGNGQPRSFAFKLSKDYIRYAGFITLLAPITIILAGSDSKTSGRGIVIRHQSIPAGIELIITLAPSLRDTSVEQTPRKLPGDHWTLTPNPRIFAAGGYTGSAGNHGAVGSMGADFPLFYDTSNPLIYGGLGARAALDSKKSARLGGNMLIGLNLDPLTLQMGIGAGAMFLPKGIATADGPAQTVVYFEAEGVASYRVVSNLELMMMISAGGAKDKAGYATAQLGAAWRF